MIRTLISGASGRMGRRLVALVHEAQDMELAGALEAPGHPDIGKDAGELGGVGSVGVSVQTALPANVDVVIDFSAPEASATLAEKCAERGVAIAIGTTGLSDEQEQRVSACAQSAAVLLAPNMSVGVNVTFETAALLAKSLGDDYDVEIVEAHHRFKKDAPSGTARRLAQRVAEALGRDPQTDVVHGREGLVGKRTGREIGMHAVRGGSIVGEHRVIFAGLGEHIELMHVAESRDVFARGALRAARALAGKSPGMYEIKDLFMSGD